MFLRNRPMPFALGAVVLLGANLGACASTPEDSAVEPTGEVTSELSIANRLACIQSRLLQRSARAPGYHFDPGKFFDDNDNWGPDDDDGDDAAALGRKVFNDRHPEGLAGNGRACADCHMASSSYQLSPAIAKARYRAMIACQKVKPNWDDPLFRPIDADDFATNGANASDFTNLTELGLVRNAIPLPINIRLVDDATGLVTNETHASVWRAVPSVFDVKLTGPDGKPPAWARGPNTNGGYQLDGRIDTLQNQAFSAFVNHAEVQSAPAPALLDNLAAFQNNLFSSNGVRRLAEAIDEGATTLPDPDPWLNSVERQGKAVFTRACGQCHGGAGTSTPIDKPPPIIQRYLDIATACPRPVDVAVPPRYAFKPCSPLLEKNVRTYEISWPPGAPPFAQVRQRLRSSDPGRALLTGFVGALRENRPPATGFPMLPPFLDDWQKLDNNNLRGIARTAPYFHNNSAKDLDEVLDHYREFFKFVKASTPPPNVNPILSSDGVVEDRPFTEAERGPLLAYLRKL